MLPSYLHYFLARLAEQVGAVWLSSDLPESAMQGTCGTPPRFLQTRTFCLERRVGATQTLLYVGPGRSFSEGKMVVLEQDGVAQLPSLLLASAVAPAGDSFFSSINSFATLILYRFTVGTSYILI